jgi:hypothetical protein
VERLWHSTPPRSLIGDIRQVLRADLRLQRAVTQRTITKE